MPKHQVNDPITDKEIAFAHMVLSGTMTDRRAAEAVGLNPDTAAYTKAKPRVQAYMIEHRAALHKEVVQQEAEGLRRLDLGREQVLARLWEIANLSHEVTRNSVTAQIKALSLIIAIEGLIPDRRAAEKKPAQPALSADIYRAAWLGKPQEETIPGHLPDLIQHDEELAISPNTTAPEAAPVPDSTPEPDMASREPIVTRPVSRAETPQWVPDAYESDFAPKRRMPLDRFGRRR